jgi:hypothetical protein
MALQMAVVRGLHASVRKRSHTDTVHTMKHLPLLMIKLERLKHFSIFLIIGEERDTSGHVTLRSVSWAVKVKLSL